MRGWDFELQRRDSGLWHMERPHFHEEYEILLPLTCGGSIFVDRQAWPLRRGFLILIDAAAPHRSFSSRSSGYSRYVLHFPRETLEAQGAAALADHLENQSRCIALGREELERCLSLFAALEEDPAGVGGTAGLLQRRAAFLGILALACRVWGGEPVQPPQRGPADLAAQAAISYIRSHLDGPITLDALASECFMSKSTLCHRFKEATGYSVGEYIIHCRVLRARSLLRCGASVQQAGEGAGFGDNAHFIRTFKRLTGLSPGQYAKSCRAAAAGRDSHV